MKKKITPFVLASVCMLGSINLMAAHTTVMKECRTLLKVGSRQAEIAGQKVEMIAPPVIKDNRTFLPLRFLSENILDASVFWDNQTKTAIVQNKETKVQVTINSNTAYVNGNKVKLDAPPVIMNDSILLPVRFMSETFGMTVDYKSSDKSITIISMRENKIPIAEFVTDQEIYTAGQTVNITNKSYDPDKESLVAELWTLNGKSYNSLEAIQKELKKPKAGSYVITLKVQDYSGSWSEQVEKTIEVQENKAPVITTFEPKKNSYAQGEDIDFNYAYENESWEDITNIRWTYRQADEPTYHTVITKPKAFFAKGDYIVTLQLTDAYGNVSAVKQTIVHITNEVKDTEFNYKFTKGEIGETIDNIVGINYRDYKDVTVKRMATNQDTLIMSDSPEDVSHNGILYSSEFQGKGRLLLHHLSSFDNSVAADKMLVVAAQNISSQPVTITLTNKVIKGPAADVMFLGQQLLRDYLKGIAPETKTLAPGEKIYLYTSADKKWLKGQCISGLMDISTTDKIRLTTAVMDKKQSISSLDGLALLDKSIHVRGTFEGTIINYDVTAQSKEASKLIVGQYEDEWVSGTDQITGEQVKNKGNYGVSYKIKITASEDTGIILNPRADIFRGAIKWEDEGTFLAPAYGYFMNTNKKGVVLGVIKAGETRTLEYMLPNGSSAPVLIGFIPASKWK